MPLPPSEEIQEFCRRTLDDPSRGVADILRIDLSGDAERIHSLLTRLLPDVPDPDLALVHLERYCRHSAPPEDPESFHVLLDLFGFSPYLADSLINDREYLPVLLRARRQMTWTDAEYRDEIARWRRISHAEPWDALRTFKRRATLRIALRDLQKRASLPEVCREISSAADALIQNGLEIVMTRLLERYGRPQAYDESGRTVEAALAVLALGKLGGMELNYSSDIDLLFVYSADGETSGMAGRPDTQISNKEFFTLAAEDLARGLGQIAGEGQLFRVDCRLRPGGRDGDLTNPTQAAEVYYRTWARAWERQALIKARPCGGDLELGARFLTALEPVIYPTVPDPATIESVREMKDRIDASLTRRGETVGNIKLGTGGIREIEFTVQALQMLHGGREPWIRESNTLLAMHRLADKGYLSVAEYGALSIAYTCLREVEHRLQIHRNLQRSTLPSSARDRRVLARAMGYRDSSHRQEAASFLADLDAHRAAVRGIYDSVLGKLSQARLEETPRPDPFLDQLSDGEGVACLAAAGIRDPESLLGSVKAIARLMAAAGTGTVSASVRREFRRVTPVLLKELAIVHKPLRALRNLERFLAALALDRGRLGELLQRRELFAPLVRLFAGSQLLSSTLLHRPELVLEEGFGVAIASTRTVADHLRHLTEGRAMSSDSHAFAAFLRVYQRNQLLYVGLKDLSRQTGPAAVARALSDFAEAILRVVVASRAAEAGWPVSPGADPAVVTGFVAVGLGKLGYRELDYSSDLDLVFLYDAGAGQDAERHAAANRLASLTVEMLTAITREGSLYAVDTRLRPFGGEGELAQPVSRLREYFSSAAGVWEMQSYLKARPLAGDLDLGWKVTRELEEFLLQRAASLDLPRAVREMKTRLEHESTARGPNATDIKLGPGGLSAVQFAIQFLQLRHRVPSPQHKRTTRLLATLKAAGLLDEEAYRVFFTGFQFLRRLEHQLRLIHGRPLSRLPTSKEPLEEVAVAMGYPEEGTVPARDRMLADLSRHRSRIESTYRRVIERATLEEIVEA